MAGLAADEQAASQCALPQPCPPSELTNDLAALGGQRNALVGKAGAGGGIRIIDRQTQRNAPAFNPQRLCNAQAQAVGSVQHALAHKVDRPGRAQKARSAAKQGVGARPGPAQLPSATEPPARGELPAENALREQRGRAAAPQRIGEPCAEHRAILAQHADPERGVERAKASICGGAHPRHAVTLAAALLCFGVSDRRGHHRSVFSAHRQAPAAKLLTQRDGTTDSLREA